LLRWVYRRNKDMRHKAEKIVLIQAEPPKESWWVGASREELQRRATHEQKRMNGSKMLLRESEKIIGTVYGRI